MSSIQDSITELQKAGKVPAILNNSIVSPLRSDDKNWYQLTLHSYFPPQVMFFAYGAVVTIECQFNNGGAKTTFTLEPSPDPNSYKIITIPKGTTQFDAQTTRVVVTEPDIAAVCTTF